MADMDDVYRLRAEDRAEIDELTRRAEEAEPGSQKVIIATKEVESYPPEGQINVFFGAAICSIGGEEVEGATATVESAGDTIFAYNCGSKWPPPGTKAEAVFVPYRWAFCYDG